MQSCVGSGGGDDRESAGNPWTRLLVMPARCDALRRIRLSFHDEHDHGTNLCLFLLWGSTSRKTWRTAYVRTVRRSRGP